ncbi:MAG: flavodoxin family protein [Deltaproteobacteria bacterium]|jgi:flavodoxin|nr:flavodoxin family protein [Deltaproteobacteria bacterium]
MKILVAYSSLTGNTQKVAEAVRNSLPTGTVLASVKEADPEGFDLVFIGFWVDKGRADSSTRSFMGKLKNQQTAFFFTLGAYPDSAHAQEVADNTSQELLAGGNKILGFFRCQGKVDPGLLEKMKTMLPPDNPHVKMTPERQAMLTEASRHPNEEDFEAAKSFVQNILAKTA